MLIHVYIHIYIYIYMYTSVLFIYSLQIFGYDSLWYNCSIVIIFFIFLVFPCFILLFVLVICAFFHTCMFLMELSLLIKNLNFEYIMNYMHYWVLLKIRRIIVYIRINCYNVILPVASNTLSFGICMVSLNDGFLTEEVSLFFLALPVTLHEL